MPRKDIFELLETRQQPAQRSGRDYWRSLNELADTEEFRECVEREFPDGASRWSNAASRRQFLKVMGASLALAGLHGCSQQPEEKILPYVQMPEEFVPGKPLFFASAMPFAGYGMGVVVESHMGRPTKVEGNHLHPASRGRTNNFAQASVLTLYDPDRSQASTRHGTIAKPGAFLENLVPWLDDLRTRGGKGLRVLTETVTSPTMAWQLEQLRETFPEVVWHQYDPVPNDSVLGGAELAFGQPVQTLYDVNRADVVLALDADFLDTRSWPLTHAFDFMQNRSLAGKEEYKTLEMNRLYVCESSPTLTGTKADHHLSLHPHDLAAVVHQVATELGMDVGSGQLSLPAHVPRAWIKHVVDDLKHFRKKGDSGGSLVIAGESLSKEMHALVHAINERLGNVGKTVKHVEPVAAQPQPHVQSLGDLVRAMKAGEVDVLLILDGNPVFTAPADLGFGVALEKVPHTVHLGLYEDETAQACDWHLPAVHYLEQWGDVRAFDGTASIIQPLIKPLYDGWSPHELLAALTSGVKQSGYDLVRSYWRERLGAEDFEAAWEDILRAGIVPDTEAAEIQPALRSADVASAWSGWVKEIKGKAPAKGDRFTALFRPDPSVWDGRFANNGWLQELPKPLSKLTWDNAAMISHQAAQTLGLNNGDIVRLKHGSHEARLPVWILPGQPRGCITLHFGYGRRKVGQVGEGTGFDVYPLRTSESAWTVEVQLQKTGEHFELATTQDHFGMHGRHPVEHGALHKLEKNPHHPEFMHDPHGPVEPSLLQYEWKYDSYKWGMAIDLTTCVGCNACTIACQAENNIPIVGKEQVNMGREMHWIRVDTYYKGAPEHPEILHQPVPCMHCEKAPCEVVCPVAATTHSDEGLNEMTYNRCVGTRYCSNNCPYKVRRFNFLEYADYDSPSLALLNNPDVTVRSRGVMEKCTYCVQRINSARIEADKADRRIRPQDLETACQAACPTQAIQFGDLNNEQWKVNEWKSNPLNYSLLKELGTQPRTTYLAEVKNPNEELEKKMKAAGRKA